MAEATDPGRSRLRSAMSKDGDGTPDTGAPNEGATLDKVMELLMGLQTTVAGFQGTLTQQGTQIATLQAQSQSPPAGGPAALTSPVNPSPIVPPGQQVPQLRRVEVKLTEFNADKVDRWFAETERALAAANVTVSTDKVAAIQRYIPDHIREVKQSIFRTNDYEQVKQAVIKAVEKSGEERYRAFQAVQMGDRKPEDFLAELLSHSPTDAQEFQDWIVKNRFLSGLPSDLAQHMQSYDFTLAAGRHADSVETYVRRVNDLYYLGKRGATVGSVDNADDDEAAVNAVMNRMGKDKFYQKFGGGPTKGASVRQQGDRRSGSGTRAGSWTDKLCRIHKTHGEKAYSCAKTDTCPMAKVLAPKPEQKNKK